jgi:hypothetical protein
VKFFDAVGRTVLLIVALGTLIGAGIVSCQTKPAALTPTELETLKLQVKQKDAQLKRQAFNQAQAEFQAAYGALMDEANAVKKDHKWPVETLFDPDKLQFSQPPATPPAQPQPQGAAPAPAKKK